MDKKNNVVKKEGYKRSFRQNTIIPCSNLELDEGKYCVNKLTKQKKLKKIASCGNGEDSQNGFCYQKCKPGFIGKGKECIPSGNVSSGNGSSLQKIYAKGIDKKARDFELRQAALRITDDKPRTIKGNNKMTLQQLYVTATNKKAREVELRRAATGGRVDSFTNITSEWLNYDKMDKKLSDLFDDNLKQYRWFFVGALLILTYFVIVNLLSSASAPSVPVQQPTIVLQMPANSLQVPQQVLQPALQLVAPAPQQIIQIPEAQLSPMKSEIPIKITDLKKTGGFNRNLFSDIETNIFSEWNESD